MTNYTATGADSGHTIILHGEEALAEYRGAVSAGEAEDIFCVQAVAELDEGEHEIVCDDGCCYGPCDLEAAQ